MILSGSEWTGVPLAAILNEAGLTGRATHVRAEGWDEGVPATAAEGTEPFFYDKGLPMQKALHPDTILAYAQNGQILEHLHGALRFACSSPAGPATGRSSGSAAWKCWITNPTAGTTTTSTTTAIRPTIPTRS